MNGDALTSQLTTCFKVPYPFIAILTWEEERALSLVRQVAASLNLPVDVHVPTAGEQADGREALLSTLANLAQREDPCVMVLPDPHAFMKDPTVTRRFRDMRSTLAERGQVVVMTMPAMAIPMELQRDVYLLELTLPSEKEISELAVAFLQDAPPDLLERVVRTARGLTLEEAGRLFRRMQAEGGVRSEEDVQAAIEEKRRLLRMSDLVELVEDVESLEGVGGLGQLKVWLDHRKKAFGEDARAFGLPQPRGLLLLGVQGCGKSLSAKAIASHWGLPLGRFDLGKLFRSSVSAEESLRQVHRLSEALSPLILWIDEIDKSFKGVGSEASETLHRVFATFITWLQEKKEPVFVVATANEVEHLPPELLRKGRFDEIFFVDLPDVHERESILKIHLRGRGRDPKDFDVASLARDAEHYSGAELEQAIISGLYDAFAEGREMIETDIRRAISETVPLYFTYEEPIKELREWCRTRARNASSDSSIIDLFEEVDGLG